MTNRTRTAIIVVAAMLGLFFGISPCPAGEFSGPVTWVYDGDTIQVLRGPDKVRVRVFGVDCPEKRQPFSREALHFAMALVKGRKVRVSVLDVDSYGRLVGRVYLPDGRELGYELLRAGLAWWYRRYSDDPEMARLEEQARAARIGLWSRPNPTPPWVFKHAAP